MKNQRALEEWLKGRELDLMTVSEVNGDFDQDIVIGAITKFLQRMCLDKSYRISRENNVYETYKIKFMYGLSKYRPTTYKEFIEKYREIEKPKSLEEMMEDLDSGIRYVVHELPVKFLLEELIKECPELLKYECHFVFVSPNSMIIERKGNTKPSNFSTFVSLELTLFELEGLISIYKKNSTSKEGPEIMEEMVECAICWCDKDNNKFMVVAVYGDQLIMEEVSRNSKKKRYVVDKNTREILFKFKEA